MTTLNTIVLPVVKTFVFRAEKNEIYNEKMTLAIRIKKARETAELTQDELADKVGCSVDLIRKLEQGNRKSTTQLVKIAMVCNVRPEWLDLGQGEMLQEVKYLQKSPSNHIVSEPASTYKTLTIEGKEIKTNENALVDMYRKLSDHSKEFVDYVTNKLYEMEYPNDKIAAPFSNHHKKPKKEN